MKNNILICYTTSPAIYYILYSKQQTHFTGLLGHKTSQDLRHNFFPGRKYIYVHWASVHEVSSYYRMLQIYYFELRFSSFISNLKRQNVFNNNLKCIFFVNTKVSLHNLFLVPSQMYDI